MNWIGNVGTKLAHHVDLQAAAANINDDHSHANLKAASRQIADRVVGGVEDEKLAMLKKG